jgi:hypothetical protein
VYSTCEIPARNAVLVSQFRNTIGLSQQERNHVQFAAQLRGTRTARGMALGECVVDEQSNGMCHGSLCFRNDFTFHGSVESFNILENLLLPGKYPVYPALPSNSHDAEMMEFGTVWARLLQTAQAWTQNSTRFWAAKSSTNRIGDWKTLV